MTEHLPEQVARYQDAVPGEPEVVLASARRKELSYSALFDKYFLPAAILLAGVMISGSLIYSRQAALSGGPSDGNLAGGDSDQEVRRDVTVDDDPMLGDPNAPVTIIEFSDFQCPFCRSFWRDTFSQIKETYINTGKVRFVYRDLPLTFHPAAEPSALAGECAQDQGKFWEMHDKIFAEQEKQGSATIQYGNADLKRWAGEIGLNQTSFNSCLDGRTYTDEVAADTKAGQSNGASGTPSFFINGKLFVGAQPFEAFRQAIEAELEENL